MADFSDIVLVECDALPIRSDKHIVEVRQFLREKAVACGLSLIDQTKFVTAASELARNTFIYGGGGEMRCVAIQRNGHTGIKPEFIDQGPGIADIKQALTDGFTSGGGMCLGLGGSKRLCEDFEIRSSVEEGT